MPWFFEPTCAAIVALSLALAVLRAPSRRQRAGRLALLALAAWVAEDSMIHAHAAYEYAPGWSAFVDRVPLLIPLIWPIVLHSAWQLARGLAPGASVGRVALVGALLVLTDAAFIEPIAVASGLWHWNLPGPFAVPIVGVLGWSFFALGAIAWLEARERGAPGPARELAILVVAPLVAHALVLASWWGALHWLGVGPAGGTVAVAFWVVSVVVSAAAARRRPRGQGLFPELAARVPAAAVFFLLLLGLDDATLRAHALAFVPPYLVLAGRELTARVVR